MAYYYNRSTFPNAYRGPSSSQSNNPYLIQRSQHGHSRSHARTRPPVQLPFEIYRQIIKHLRDCRSDLVALMLTSKIVHAEAERILYRYVSLADPSAQREFCHQILARPRVASLVRRYHFSTEHRSKHVGSNEPDATAQDLKLLARTLPMLTGLRDLKFSFQPEGEDCPAFILNSCAFQLKSFEWDTDCCTEDLVPFLNRPQLQGLQHLRLAMWPSGLSPRHLWPNLRSLAGGDDTIAAVLPRREITQVHWTTHISLEELTRKIRPDRLLHNVRILSLCHTNHTHKEQIILFKYLGQLFPGLQVLEDIQYCTLGEHGVRANGKLMVDLSQKHFPNLHTLIFSPIRYLGYDAPEMQGLVARAIFRKWQSLRRIDIIHHLCRDVENDLDDETYERWHRGMNYRMSVDDAKLVAADQVVWWK